MECNFQQTRDSFGCGWFVIWMGLHLVFIVPMTAYAEGLEKTSPTLREQPGTRTIEQLAVASRQDPDDETATVNSKKAAAKNDDGRNRKPPRAIYLHAERRQTGEKISRLLKGYRIDCRLLPAKDLGKKDLDDVDLIIVGADTKLSWEAEGAVDHIKKSQLPVLAMGEGGYQLFGKLGLRIGAPHGQLGKITPLTPNAEAIFWDGFRPEPVNGSYDVFSGGAQISIKLEDSFDDAIPIASEVDSEELFPLIVQKPYYLLNGFNGTFDQMTKSGHELLAWACYYTVAMKQNPDRAFMSTSEVEKIKKHME